jgi:phage shock protein A
MLVTTDEIKSAWLSPSRQLSIRVKMNNVTYGSEDITSLSFDSGSISGEVFQIGSTYMNSIQLIFPSIIEDVDEDLEVIPELGVMVSGEYQYTKLGHFFVDEFERNRNNNTTSITATDKMRFMEGTYESKLSYPKSYKEVAVEVANLAGVEINQASFASLGTSTINKAEGYTHRQAIGLIAQFEGGFASFNRNGELEIRRLAPTTFEVTPESYMLKGFTKNEASYRIGGITVRTGDEEADVLRVGSTNGSQVELENKVMTQSLLNQMWDLVKTLNYFPYELKWRGCPPLEAGDWIYITAKDGTKYSVPNLSYSITFSGGMSAESKATTSSSSQATYKYRGTLNQRVDTVESILGSNNWNTNYYDTTEPSNPKEGDTWFKPNGNDTEIWVYKNVNGKLEWVKEISSAPDETIQQAIEDIQKDLDETINAINNAVDQANQAVAKVDSLDKAVNVALEQSTNAIDQAQQAIKDANNLLTTVTEIQGTITSISAVVDEVNNQLAVKVSQTDFDKLKGTVDTQAVQISANEKQIALKASQTSVDTITNNVTDIQSELKTQAGSITAINTRVDGQQTQIGVLESSYSGLSSTIANVQNDFDNLSIGGRNYIKNSQFKNGLNDWISTPNLKSKVSSPFIEMTSSVISDYIGIHQVFNISLKAGDIITVSLDAYNLSSDSNGLQVGVHWRDNTGIIAQSWADVNNKSTTRVALTSSTKRYSFSYRVPPGVNTTSVNLMIYGARGLSFNIAVGNIKLEKGNKATDWSPAPEELATVTEMSNITQTVKDIQLSVADKVSQAQFTILSNQVTTTVSKIDNMEVGGRNWIKNSESPKFVGYQGAVISYVEKQAVPEWNATNAVKHTVTGGTAGRIAAVLGSGVQTYLNKGVDYVHSIYVKNVGKTNVTINNNLGQTVTVAPNESKRVVIHGKSNPTQNQAMQFVLYRDVQTDTLEFIIWHAQIEEATVVSAWKPALETLATFSQITQLSDAINLRVQKNDVVNQINISTEGILIAGKKIQITGETYIANAVIKTANIADLAITNAKIANATIASAKIISIDASKVTASTLSSIVSNTGNLNVSGTLTMSTDNSGITGTFNAGDRWGESYNPRWFQGSYTVGRRFIKFLSNVHELTTADAQGSFLHYSESYFGGDYFKLRSYATKNSTSTLKGRIDMTGAGGIEVSDSWGSVSPKATISPDGSASFAGGVYSPTHVTTGRIIPNLSYQTFQINEGKLNGMHTLSMSATPNVNITANQTKAASMAIGTDNNPRVWFASGVYNRTYASTANMIVTDQGTIGRVTSASKYKLAISEVPDALDLGYKLLTVSPKMWYDKTEIELLSEEITTGKSQSGDTLLARSHYGLIAEDLRAAGLDNYISINQTTKEIEGIEYDRLWTALIPVIKDLVERKVMNEIRLNKLERIMEELRNG